MQLEFAEGLKSFSKFLLHLIDIYHIKHAEAFSLTVLYKSAPEGAALRESPQIGADVICNRTWQTEPSEYPNM